MSQVYAALSYSMCKMRDFWGDPAQVEDLLNPNFFFLLEYS